MIGYYKSEDSRIFFLFPSSSSLVAKKQKILLLVFSDEPRGENKKEEIEKKQKKFTHSHHLLSQLCQRRVAPTYSRKFPSSSSCFSEGTSSSQQLEYWTDRTNKLSLTKMKRLFGVKKTVEAPSLEETTGKVILLSSFRLLLCLLLLFSFLVAHPKLIIHLRVQHHKTN